MSTERRPNLEPARRPGPPEQRARRSGDSDEFWSNLGVDIEGMSPRAQAATGLAVGGTILAGAVLVLALNPAYFWLIFIFGWILFPALGVFARGVAGLVDSSPPQKLESSRERELLEALRERGEITPTQAAMETSLTVSEADSMLKKLAEGGHLEVRVRGGGLFYALWEHEAEEGGKT